MHGFMTSPVQNTSTTSTTGKRPSSVMNESNDDENSGRQSSHQQAVSVSPSSSDPLQLTAYPLTIAEYQTGQYGETNNIAVRLSLPEGTRKFRVSLHHDHQGADMDFVWPVSMRESRPVDGIPNQALQALNQSFLSMLTEQNLPIDQGPRCRITKRFPFAVCPEDSKRVQVLHETTIGENVKVKTVILTFEAASNKMPVDLQKEMQLL